QLLKYRRCLGRLPRRLSDLRHAHPQVRVRNVLRRNGAASNHQETAHATIDYPRAVAGMDAPRPEPRRFHEGGPRFLSAMSRMIMRVSSACSIFICPKTRRISPPLSGFMAAA